MVIRNVGDQHGGIDWGSLSKRLSLMSGRRAAQEKSNNDCPLTSMPKRMWCGVDKIVLRIKRRASSPSVSVRYIIALACGIEKLTDLQPGSQE